MVELRSSTGDAASRATAYSRELWLRRRAARDVHVPLALADVAKRLDVLLRAVFGRRFPIRKAEPALPPSLLERVLRPHHGPRQRGAVPATDGTSIWLPAEAGVDDAQTALCRIRVMALQQALRACRGSAWPRAQESPPLVRDCYLLLEALAADSDLVALLPGMRESIDELRRAALRSRPPLEAFPAGRRVLEQLAREALSSASGAAVAALPRCATPAQSLHEATQLVAQLAPDARRSQAMGVALLHDAWTGELRPSTVDVPITDLVPRDVRVGHDVEWRSRSSRLWCRPEAREPGDDEVPEAASPGAWRIQSRKPRGNFEDPLGMQRPAAGDENTGSTQFVDSISQWARVRLVRPNGHAPASLRAHDAPTSSANGARPSPTVAPCVEYPEWDWRIGAYRSPGALVHVLAPQLGPAAWVERTLAQRRSLLDDVRRRFEMLRGRCLRLRRQLDGDEPDLDAWTESWADFRAGCALSQSLYQALRPARRDIAVLVLVDASGSTEAWLSDRRRIVDVEREALLLVCVALEGAGERFAILAFSGEGPHRVTVRELKRFDERCSGAITQRIAALEPEHFTRAGAAIRHATAMLMHEQAAQRLLLLLSDGRPNDLDDYEGRYGVEDTRQSVLEAKAQGIVPFCLTVDRQAANDLSAVFGCGQFALLPRPELLASALVDWLRRLLPR